MPVHFDPKPAARSVSIIGVGCTPFSFTLDNPETAGICEGEMFGYAALEAMEDAGVEPADVQYYYQAQALPIQQSDYMTHNMQVASWFGMKGKGSLGHSEACCSSYVGLEQAVNAVASGTYDMVLIGCCDMSDSKGIPDKPAHIREKLTFETFAEGITKLYSRDYTRPWLGANPVMSDGWLSQYGERYGVTKEQLDDALIELAIVCRRNAVAHPLGISTKTYEELAEEAGFDDVHDYMKSTHNAKVSEFLRSSGFEQKCDGAGALIVCPTEVAKRYCEHPIEVLGIGHSNLDGINGILEETATREAYRQVKNLTGLSGADMDVLYAQDFVMGSQMLAAEVCEYIPEGRSWEYLLDHRTAIDGDRPMNTNGGRCHFGHAHGSSGMADLFEAVKQMRGEAGPTQLPNIPKTAMIRGFGGGQNVVIAVLRTVE